MGGHFQMPDVDRFIELSSSNDCNQQNFFFTSLPFDDNYFYHGWDGHHIISMHGWSLLTDVPLSNGALHLLCRVILKHELGVGGNHDHSTGCLNDFMWDKRIIGAAIRASFFCPDCLDETSADTKNSLVFKELTALLEYNASQSRAGIDVLESFDIELTTTEAIPRDQLGAFLCHNSADKDAVRALNQELKRRGVITWFDEDQLHPGAVWQSELEQAISRVTSCLICVGPAGEGPWQEAERRAFISEFVTRGIRVIPVLLPGCASIPDLPIFLKQFMWSDLRADDQGQLERLVHSLKQ